MTTNAFEARREAVLAGLSRGWIETRHMLTDTASVIWYFAFPVIFAIMLLIMRGRTVPGTEFALGAMVLPSLVGMSIAFGGLMGPAGTIAADREDGTMLRAKATPNGMVGYLVGKIVMFALVFIVGMVSTVPISVVLGSLMRSAAQTGLLFLASMLLIVPSGIFYPITAMPIWLQCMGQAFPFYWLGLGARSAMLPEAMAAVEIGGSWRTFEMFVVLGVWAVIGMALAPMVLRRMARRQSGAAVAAARERIMSKGY